LKFSRVVVCVLALLFAQGADARNILFIDLNNAAAETRAVRESLSANDQLFVVPSNQFLDGKRRAEILRVTQHIDATTKQATDCKSRGRVHCERLWLELRELNLARAKLTDQYSSDDLIADIKAMAQSSIRFDTLVISGHHSGSYFRGELAQFEANDLLRFDVELTQELGGVKSLLLLGCETGVPALMSDLFVKALPSLQLIVGAEDNAPTRNEQRNLGFIRKYIREEPSLIASTNAAQVGQRYRSLLQAAWPVSMLWQKRYFFSKDWQGAIETMPASVAATFKNSQQALAIATPVRNAAPVESSTATSRNDTALRTQRATRTGDPLAPMHTPREAIEILNSR
jgi:hypothetical protein